MRYLVRLRPLSGHARSFRRGFRGINLSGAIRAITKRTTPSSHGGRNYGLAGPAVPSHGTVTPFPERQVMP